MSLPEIPALTDIVTAIILVVPGFVIFFIAKVVGGVKKAFSDLETTLFGIFLSLINYVPFTILTGLTSFDAIRTGILDPYNMIILLVLIVALGVALGIIFRVIFRGEGGSIWNATFERINRAGGSTVLVITQSDKEYKGIASIASQSSPEEKKELIISSPTLVVRNQDGTVLNEVQMGSEILFINEDIKRIIILDDLEANGA